MQHARRPTGVAAVNYCCLIKQGDRQRCAVECSLSRSVMALLQ